MPTNDPVFFEAGFAFDDFYPTALDTDGVLMQVITNVALYLDTLTGNDNNGEALIIGTNYQRQVAGVYRFATDTGWTCRIITTATLAGGGGAAALDTVFAEMAAGTYIPRYVYVEGAGSFSSPWLTDARYLFLRDLMRDGNTALHLQVEPVNTSSTAGRPMGWVSTFTDGDLIFTWETITGYQTAGGYFSDSTNRNKRYRRATTFPHPFDDPPPFNVGKPFIEDIPSITARNAWGHFRSDTISYHNVQARALILTSAAEDYSFLGVGGIRLVTGLFGHDTAPVVTTKPHGRLYPRDDSPARLYPPPGAIRPGRLTGYL